MSHEINAQKTFMIHNQYTKDLSFENPRIPGTFAIDSEPTFNISIDINTAKIEGDVYEVVLSCTISAKNEDVIMFHISLDYGGMFTINTDGDEGELERLLLVQCPSILFPFARRIIANASVDGGYPPVSLEPVDFYSLYLQKQQLNSNGLNGGNNHTNH